MGLSTCWKQGLRKKFEGFPAPASDSRVASSSSLRARACTNTHTSHMYTQCPDIPRNINTDTLHTGNGRHRPTGRETLCQLPAYLVEMSCCSSEAPLETSLCLRVWGWRGATLAVRKAGAPGRGDEGVGWAENIPAALMVPSHLQWVPCLQQVSARSSSHQDSVSWVWYRWSLLALQAVASGSVEGS